MSSLALPFDPNKFDTLTVSLFAAAVLHVLIILGVSFEPFLNELRAPASMEVILVQPSDSETPENADYLLFSPDAKLPPAGLVGITMGDTEQGVKVGSIIAKEAAEKAGIKKNDNIKRHYKF